MQTGHRQRVSLKNRLAYVGDQNGILNRYTARFDSTISYIDTTTHFRYYINSSRFRITIAIS